MKEQKSLICWIKDHKKELILAGFSISTLLLIILGIQNRDKIIAVWDSLRNVIKQQPAIATVTEDIPKETINEIVVVASNSDSIPFEVSRHIRNLPNGWHASPEKIAEALEKNIILMDGQTWVDSYIKRGAVA